MVYHLQKGDEYESSDMECQSPLRANETKLAELQMDIGSTLKLTYDYGTTRSYEMKLVATDVLKDGDTAASFPRNQPLSGSIPTSYSKYQPDDSTERTLSRSQSLDI